MQSLRLLLPIMVVLGAACAIEAEKSNDDPPDSGLSTSQLYDWSCDEFTCVDPDLQEEDRCVWECHDVGGTPVRIEVTFGTNDDGCYNPELDIENADCE
jgi:hypothetical protein